MHKVETIIYLGSFRLVNITKFDRKEDAEKFARLWKGEVINVEFMSI